MSLQVFFLKSVLPPNFSPHHFSFLILASPFWCLGLGVYSQSVTDSSRDDHIFLLISRPLGVHPWPWHWIPRIGLTALTRILLRRFLTDLWALHARSFVYPEFFSLSYLNCYLFRGRLIHSHLIRIRMTKIFERSNTNSWASLPKGDFLVLLLIKPDHQPTTLWRWSPWFGDFPPKYKGS